MAPRAESVNRNVPIRAFSPAASGAGPPNQVVASWWGPANTRAESDRSGASKTTASKPRIDWRRVLAPGITDVGITVCSPAGAKKNWRAMRGPA